MRNKAAERKTPKLLLVLRNMPTSDTFLFTIEMVIEMIEVFMLPTDYFAQAYNVFLNGETRSLNW